MIQFTDRYTDPARRSSSSPKSVSLQIAASSKEGYSRPQVMHSLMMAPPFVTKRSLPASGRDLFWNTVVSRAALVFVSSAGIRVLVL